MSNSGKQGPAWALWGLTAALSLLGSCGGPEVQDPVSLYWGRSHRELIRRAKEAKVYLVAPDREPVLLKELGLEDLGLVQRVLEDPSTYLFEIQKKTPFFPDRALDLVDGTQKLRIFFMRSASILGYETTTQIKVEDYDGGRDLLDRILQ